MNSGLTAKRSSQPLSPGGNKLGQAAHPVTNELGRDAVLMGEAPRHSGRQAFASVFIDDIEDPESLAIVGAVLHEVITPEVFGELRP